MIKNNNDSVTKNLMWRFLERFGAKGVSVIVQLVLARRLGAEVFGTVAIVYSLMVIMQVFVDSGLPNALIQKKNATDTDFSSVFYFNTALCIILYLVMFFLAPLIASFYDNPELVPLIRVLSVMLLISGPKSIQQAYVSRNMLFRRFFFATLGGTIGAAAVGIVMAYTGFGVWALVAQYIFNAAVDTLILWITVKWRPKKLFSLKSISALFSYGWKLLVSALIENLYVKLRQFIIGKKYTNEDLGLYDNGQKIPEFLVGCINTSIDSVLFPSMSKVQDDKDAVRQMTRRSISVSSYVMWPMMVGLAVTALPLLRFLLGEDWVGSVPYLQIFCIVYAFYPMHTANLNAMKALGRSDLYLRLEVIKKVIGLVILAVSMWFGVKAIALSLLVTSFTSQILNSLPNKKLLGYSYPAQLKDILPAVILSAIMGAAVYSVILLGLPDIVTLLIQIPLGAVIYISLSYIFRIGSFMYIIESAKKILVKRK